MAHSLYVSTELQGRGVLIDGNSDGLKHLSDKLDSIITSKNSVTLTIPELGAGGLCQQNSTHDWENVTKMEVFILESKSLSQQLIASNNARLSVRTKNSDNTVSIIGTHDGLLSLKESIDSLLNLSEDYMNKNKIEDNILMAPEWGGIGIFLEDSTEEWTSVGKLKIVRWE